MEVQDTVIEIAYLHLNLKVFWASGLRQKDTTYAYNFAVSQNPSKMRVENFFTA